MPAPCAQLLTVAGLVALAWAETTAAADLPRRSSAFVCTAVDTAPEEARRFGVGTVPSVRGTAYAKDRWLPGHGLTPNTGVITLGVHFMNGSGSQHAFVRRVAPEWTTGALGRRLKFRFDVARDRSDIRIRFNAGGDFSKVGRENRDVPKSQATMTLKVADRRAVLHEFGHALGLRHEHHHPRNGIQWRESVVIAELAAYGWTEAMVRANILDKFPAEAACLGDPEFNRNSIMIYPIQSHWTRNGFSTPVITSISNRDRRCLEGLYRP